MRCEFTIPGQPQPKQRARKGRGGRWYTPARTARFERSVGQYGDIARPGSWPLNATYRVRIELHHGDARRRDGDNCVKSILDGLNGVLWDDDHQVREITAVTAPIDREAPRAVVVVEALSHE